MTDAEITPTGAALCLERIGYVPDLETLASQAEYCEHLRRIEVVREFIEARRMAFNGSWSGHWTDVGPEGMVLFE